MNELIKIEINENQEVVISGRDLHDKLNIESKYIDWINRMIDYGFSENIDFIYSSELSQKKEGSRIVNREITNHTLSLDMAKEIAMLQRNEKGKEVRRYFIQIEKDFNSPEKVMARALILADKKIREKDFLIDNLHQRIVEQTPKVEFAEAFEISASSVLIGELAKMINQNGIDIGQNRLFSLLRDRGYLCNRGEQRNLPTQKSLDLGLMEIKKSIINQGDGVTRVTTTPKVTSKGQSYFINKMLSERKGD